MRVFLYSRAFLPALGGIEQASYLLARELTARGHQVTVATDVPADQAFDASLGFEVLRRRSFSALVRAARTADVVHTNGHSIPAVVLAEAARRPLVVTHGGYQATCLNGLGWHDGQRCGYVLRTCAALTARHQGAKLAARQLVRHAAARATLSRAAAHVAVSAFVRDRIAAPRSEVVFNCADTSIYRPDPGAVQSERILFVGRFVAEKGVDVLLRAVAVCARRNTPVALDLVGAGPLEGDYRRQIHELGISKWVTFRGRLHGDALASAVRASTGVVVPSVWDEAFGIVAAEAMSCGRVALVSDAGGLPEVVADPECTVPAGDADAWATALIRLTTDADWRQQKEAALPARAARYTEAEHVVRYLTVYNSALGTRLV